MTHFTKLRLILGDQLHPHHSWYREIDPHTLYVMMEIREETDYVLHHAQKLIAFFAAMRDFSQALQTQGHAVRYFSLRDANNLHHLKDNLLQVIHEHGIRTIEWQHPDEWRVQQTLHQFADELRALGIQASACESEHFLLPYSEILDQAAQLSGRVMEYFYRDMRRRFKVLMDGAKPVGGRWNFDQENRSAWQGQPAEPSDARITHQHQAIWEEIQALGIPSFGNAQAEHFPWPLNRQEALRQLDHFLTHSLPHFGEFQDAMHQDGVRLFHSLLSFALNTKMVHPLEVIRRAELMYQNEHVSLAAVEGFIRQILGWREYVRCMYWAKMPSYRELNYFHHERPLPTWFWNAKTQMNCMSQCIGNSLDHAYAHHIQRLMIIGNFSLLAGLNPHAVHEWYLGVYIDALEWVELPNTLGMSQYADGGMLATKPYASTAAYIHRMSNYCSNCSYDRTTRVEPDSCPFNSLYWEFHMRNHERLASNPRLKFIYAQLSKMSGEEKDAIQVRADFCKENLAHL